MDTKIICVCEHCGHHENDTGVEFNFRDKKIYWFCPECKKMNDISLDIVAPAPYPKSKRMGNRK